MGILYHDLPNKGWGVDEISPKQAPLIFTQATTRGWLNEEEVEHTCKAHLCSFPGRDTSGYVSHLWKEKHQFCKVGRFQPMSGMPPLHEDDGVNVNINNLKLKESFFLVVYILCVQKWSVKHPKVAMHPGRSHSTHSEKNSRRVASL